MGILEVSQSLHRFVEVLIDLLSCNLSRGFHKSRSHLKESNRHILHDFLKRAPIPRNCRTLARMWGLPLPSLIPGSFFFPAIRYIAIFDRLPVTTPAIFMASSLPEQPSDPDPGSVLCDKCKKSVLEPAQNTENVRLAEGVQQGVRAWLLSPRMWPVGYILGSPYSPFRMEQELPKREWRNAFEDLVALESGSEMISQESREQEKIVAASIGWERASDCIQKLNRLNTRDSKWFSLLRTALDKAKAAGSQEDTLRVSGLEWSLQELKEMIQRRVAIAEAFKAREANRAAFSASRHKDRGQWIASLITSGALRGWTSLLADSEIGDVIAMDKQEESEDNEYNCKFSEQELRAHFDDGQPLAQSIPGPPLYMVSKPRPAAVVQDESVIIDEEGPEQPTGASGAYVPSVVSRTPERPYFSSQRTSAERITLPNGKKGIKVVMKNSLTNGDVEEKVMIQEPGKVLREVEKARALIHDRLLGFDKPIID